MLETPRLGVQALQRRELLLRCVASAIPPSRRRDALAGHTWRMDSRCGQNLFTDLPSALRGQSWFRDGPRGGVDPPSASGYLWAFVARFKPR